MNPLVEKLKEVLFAVLPIYVIVLVLHFTLTPLPGNMLIQFTLGALLVIIGLAVFLLGVDRAISPIGDNIGAFVSKSGKLWVVIAVGLVLGFLISIAEPDLQILAGQVSDVTAGLISKVSIVVVVSLGIAVMLSVGLIRIVYNIPLYKMLIAIYALIFVLCFFIPPEFLAIAFDASGATTGALTVPFILALSLGVSAIKKDSKASEKDSFGLVAIASTGAILGVQLMGIFKGADSFVGGTAETAAVESTMFSTFKHVAADSAVALLPLLGIYLVFQLTLLHLPKKHFFRILKGFVYTYMGLVMFLFGVESGFMKVGTELGKSIAQQDFAMVAVLVGFLLGVVTILAEPAVHVLTHQVETVTAGSVKRNTVLAALAMGVGVAVALSILRILVPQIQLWHYLLPGYAISLALTLITPKLFVGIAFDSGGVASGPMTATFILAFAQGVASSVASADVLKDAFGMIALVAMTPLIAIQVLGLLYKLKSIKKGGDSHIV